MRPTKNLRRLVLLSFCLHVSQTVALTSKAQTKGSADRLIHRQGLWSKRPSWNENLLVLLPNKARSRLRIKLNEGGNISEGRLWNLGNGLRCACDAYFDALAKRPLLTQSLTAAVLTVLGELVANCARFVTVKSVGGGGPMVDFVSPTRLVAFFFCGALFSGPYLHFWYQILWWIGGRLEEQYGASPKRQALVQMIVDQTIGAGFFIPTYFYVYEIMEACTMGQLPLWGLTTSKMRAELVRTLITNWKVWPLFNLVNFSYLPQKFRFLASNVAAIFWNAYLCIMVA
jgi:Mpv17 / PMP22 family